MAACPQCGSSSPRRSADELTGVCANEKGCNERRCQRRIDEDDKRRSPNGQQRRQCTATTGDRSTRFCQMREGHKGNHVCGTREWSGNNTHPIAAILHLSGS